MEHLAEPSRRYVTLDDLRARALAKQAPARFIAENHPPCIYDEVPYAPELFPYIKIYVDTHKKDGLFWLTGSQKYRLIQGIQESLTGRIAIINMLGSFPKLNINRHTNHKVFYDSCIQTYAAHLCS